MLISQAYQLFVTERKIAQVSPRTIDAYHDALQPIVDRAGDVTTELLQVHIDDHLLELGDRGLAPASVHTYWRGIKTFVRWCAEEGYCPPIKLPKIGRPQTVIRPLNADQMQQILRAQKADFYGVRNRAILHLLYDTGLRVSELCRLEEQDLDWTERWLFVQGKGRKERWVPFGLASRKLLWDYWKQRARYATSAQRSIFITKTNRPLQRRGVQMIFRELQGRFSFPGVRLSAHTLRHSFAVAYIEAGGDPFSLQRILGHADQEMTSRYVYLGKTNLGEQHQHYAPGDRLGIKKP